MAEAAGTLGMPAKSDAGSGEEVGLGEGRRGRRVSWLALTGALLLALVLGGTLLAPRVSPYNPAEQRARERLQAPSSAHLFGTDHLGRDVFSRVLHGGRASLTASVGALALTLNLLIAAQASVPRPEHPRPDAIRENWMTLNGEWQFEIDSTNDGEGRGLKSGTDLESKIIVPFCPESQLSGIGHYGLMKNVWYRRHFEVPANMKGQRVR